MMSASAVRKRPDKACAKIFATYGLPSKVARACKLTPQAVYQWTQVPPQWVQTVAPIIDMDPADIRPDIFRPIKKRA